MKWSEVFVGGLVLYFENSYDHFPVEPNYIGVFMRHGKLMNFHESDLPYILINK